MQIVIIHIKSINQSIIIIIIITYQDKFEHFAVVDNKITVLTKLRKGLWRKGQSACKEAPI